MKEITKLFIVLCMVFVLLGCNNAKLVNQENNFIEPEIPIDYMEDTSNYNFSQELAVKLGKLCKQTYLQYEAHKNKEAWITPAGYTFLETLYAVYEGNTVSIGFILKNNNDIYISWRGTDNFEEWIQDVKFEQADCTFLINNSKVELGFYELYTTGNTPKHKSPRDTCIDFLQTVDNIENIYITGHSLGSSLAIINAADIAYNTEFIPTVYTLAGPRTGNHDFAFNYNQMVKNTWRIVNSHDEVPKLPPKSCPPLIHKYNFEHVNNEYSITFGNWWNLPHDHSVDNYIQELER